MSYTRDEYVETTIFTENELWKIYDAQHNIRTKGYEDQDESGLASALSASTTILSLAFMLPTPVTLAAGVISIVTLWPSERDNLIRVCEDGEDFWHEAFSMIYTTPDADAIKLKVSYLEFVDEGYRICTQGEILSIHTPNGWILA